MTFETLKNRVKKSYKSLTIWWNVSGIAILTVIVSTPELITFLNQNDLSFLILAGNLILRFKTTNDMADK